MNKALVIIFSFLFIFSYKSNAQNLDFGLQGGGTFYLGELNKTIFNNPSFAGGAFVRLNINEYWAVRLNYMNIGLNCKGTNPENYKLISIHKPVNEITAQVDFNFFKFSEEGIRNRVTPYVAVGGGIMIYKGEISSNQVRAIIPFGIGGKFCLTKNLVLGIEWMWRKTFNADDLDNVVIKLGKKGQSLYSDWYSTFGISISYGFNVLSKDKCRTQHKYR